jgi:hypothetical protein
MDSSEMRVPSHVATTVPPSVLKDAVRGSACTTVGVDLGPGRGGPGVEPGPTEGEGTVTGRVADGRGDWLPDEVTTGRGRTLSAADARPTARPVRSTTTKVIAPTATTTASQASTMPSSGRGPIPTFFTCFLL